MKSKYILTIYPLLTITFFLFLLSCKKQSDNTDCSCNLKGTLKGNISIGPLCPVETTPPLPQCQPTEATYKAWAVAVCTQDKKSKIAVLNPQLDGNYQIDITAGVYVIDFDPADNITMRMSNMPATITIEAKQTSTFDINIDTGIR